MLKKIFALSLCILFILSTLVFFASCDSKPEYTDDAPVVDEDGNAITEKSESMLPTNSYDADKSEEID